MARRTVLIAATVCALFTSAGGASAANLVQNGGFESLTHGPNYFIATGASELLNWSYGSWPYPNAAVYTLAGAEGLGAFDNPLGIYVPLYTSGQGYNSGFVGSPDGGNFLASDSEAQYRGAISQTISGLTVGQSYKLSFDWAGEQFLDYTSVQFNDPLTSSWQVSFGADTVTTPSAAYPSHGFSGWQHQTFTFTATDASEALSFLALGTPDGLPPVSLLDGVSLTAVPEPDAWTMMIVGLGLLGGFARRRRALEHSVAI